MTQSNPPEPRPPVAPGRATFGFAFEFPVALLVAALCGCVGVACRYIEMHVAGEAWHAVMGGLSRLGNRPLAPLTLLVESGITLLCQGVGVLLMCQAAASGRLDWRQVGRALRTRWPTLAHLAAIYGACALLSLLAVVGFSAGGAPGEAAAANPGAFLPMLALATAMVFVGLRCFIAAPIVMVEGATAVDALAESWRRQRGRAVATFFSALFVAMPAMLVQLGILLGVGVQRFGGLADPASLAGVALGCAVAAASAPAVFLPGVIYLITRPRQFVAASSDEDTRAAA
jgi:hypothetical protein